MFLLVQFYGEEETFLQKSLNYEIVERRLGDITAAYADTTIANEVLNWKSEKTLEEAILSAWKWQQQQN